MPLRAACSRLSKHQVPGRCLPRPTAPSAVPGFALKAALGQFAEEGVLIGQRLAPHALAASGFAFAHPELRAALEIGLEKH